DLVGEDRQRRLRIRPAAWRHHAGIMDRGSGHRRSPARCHSRTLMGAFAEPASPLSPTLGEWHAADCARASARSVSGETVPLFLGAGPLEDRPALRPRPSVEDTALGLAPVTVGELEVVLEGRGL